MLNSDFLVKARGSFACPSLDGVEWDDHDTFAALAFQFKGVASDFCNQLAAFTAGL